MEICLCGSKHILGTKEELKTLVEICHIEDYDILWYNSSNHILWLYIDDSVWDTIQYAIDSYNNSPGSSYAGLTCVEFCASILNKKVL